MIQLVILISCVVSLILFLLFIAVFWIYYINLRVSTGVIIFKIDTLNHRVIRINEKSPLFPILFDARKLKFEPFNYISFSEFLNFFEVENQKDLKIYFEQNAVHRVSLKLQLNMNLYKRLTFFERILFKIDSRTKRLENTICELRVFPQDDGIFICNINWRINNDHNSKKIEFVNSKNNTIQKLVRGPFLALTILKKPFFFVNEILNSDIEQILDRFGLKLNRVQLYSKDGIIMILFKKTFLTNIKKINSIVKNLNENSLYEKMVDCASVIEFKRMIDLDDFENLVNQSKYTLYNIKNNKLSNEFYYFKPKDVYKPEFVEFVSLYNTFRNKNLTSDFLLIKNSIVNYESKNKTKNNVFSVWINGMSKDVIEFFLKIPYLVYLYEPLWINKIISKEKEIEIGKLASRIIVKISQENFMKLSNYDTSSKITYLIYSFDNLFNYEELKKKIKILRENSISCAVYVKRINKPLMNFLGSSNLKAIVISEQISKKINDESTFFDCVNIYQIAQSNKISLFYELENFALDKYIVEKTGIYAAYLPQFSKIKLENT